MPLHHSCCERHCSRTTSAAKIPGRIPCIVRSGRDSGSPQPLAATRTTAARLVRLWYGPDRRALNWYQATTCRRLKSRLWAYGHETHLRGLGPDSARPRRRADTRVRPYSGGRSRPQAWLQPPAGGDEKSTYERVACTHGRGCTYAGLAQSFLIEFKLGRPRLVPGTGCATLWMRPRRFATNRPLPPKGGNGYGGNGQSGSCCVCRRRCDISPNLRPRRAASVQRIAALSGAGFRSESARMRPGHGRRPALDPVRWPPGSQAGWLYLSGTLEPTDYRATFGFPAAASGTAGQTGQPGATPGRERQDGKEPS